MQGGGECGRKEDRDCVGVGGKNGKARMGERELTEHSAYHNCVYDKL